MKGFVHRGSFKRGHAQLNTGRTHFKKGDTPWTKSNPGIHLSPATEFKKGCSARNRLPLGAIVERRCKGGHVRRYIKVGEPSKWIAFALFVCICEWGEIPDGHFPHHVDGNTLNDSVDNLQLVTRGQHCSIHRPAGGKLSEVGDAGIN